MNTSRSQEHSPNLPPVVLDVRVVCGTGGGPDKTILNSPRFFEPLGFPKPLRLHASAARSRL